jgi:hypothetical protein
MPQAHRSAYLYALGLTSNLLHGNDAIDMSLDIEDFHFAKPLTCIGRVGVGVERVVPDLRGLVDTEIEDIVLAIVLRSTN